MKPNTAMKASPGTKLRTSALRPSRRTHVFLDERADRHLATTLVLSTQILRRPVSASLIVRRALEVLAERLGDMTTESQRKTEATALTQSAAR